ncbi:MAG: GNAT family N-acetyltransferase [Alkalispirochaeta sp.]
MAAERKWRIFTTLGDPGFEAFLTGHEPYTTVMSEKYRTGEVDRRLKKGGRFYRFGDTTAIYHGPGGFFYPFGVAPEAPVPEQLREQMGSFLKLYAVMGQRDDVLAFIRCFAGRPAITVDYFLLRHSSKVSAALPESPHPDITVGTPSLSEWKRLLPLHLAYEAEEVLLPGRKVDPAMSKVTLTESLQTQEVLVAYYRGEAIGRVATNARGYRTDQIGGVYTAPAWRGRGLARYLMSHMMRRLADEGRGTALFVKPHNLAALRLYEKLGYLFESDFRISYYR